MKVSDLKNHIKTLYNAGARHTLFLQGPPGIGKSESSLEAAKELSLRNDKDGNKIPLQTRQWQATIEDPLELPGLPAVENRKAYRAPFEDKIPTEGEGLLIIDEINSAPALTQASLYSLVWDKKLGGTELSKDWMIIATGNQDKDRAVTQRMPTPLVSRMEHITVEADLDSWMIKMAVEDRSESVRAFMKHRPDLFVNFKPDVPGPFACPRTWKMVSDVMQAYEKAKSRPPIESIEGWVGKGPAVEYMTYVDQMAHLVPPELIIKEPLKAPTLKDNPGALYALTTALAGRIDFSNAKNIFTWLDRIQVEFQVYFVQSARDVLKGRLEKLTEKEKDEKKGVRFTSNESYRQWCLKNFVIADK